MAHPVCVCVCVCVYVCTERFRRRTAVDKPFGWMQSVYAAYSVGATLLSHAELISNNNAGAH